MSVSFEDSVTVSQSVSLSEVVVSVTMVSETVRVTYIVSEWEIVGADGSDSFSQTLVASETVEQVVLISVSRVQVELPVYVSRIVQVTRVIRLTTASAQAGSGMSSGTLIGTVTGAAIVVALVVAGAVFIVRSKKGPAHNRYSTESDSQVEIAASSRRVVRGFHDTEEAEELAELPQAHNLFGVGFTNDIMTTLGGTEHPGTQDGIDLYV
jgi:hypothetical protein